MRRIFIVLGLSLVAFGASLGGLGVVRHARSERMLRVPLTLAGAADGHELLRVRLEQGQSFYAELCAEGMTPSDLAGASFLLRHVDEDVVVREVALDARFFEHLRAVPSGVCGLLVSASSLGVGGEYALAMRRAEPQARATSRRLELRLVARSALSLSDRAAVWSASLGALLLLLGLALGRPSRAPSEDDSVDPGRHLVHAAVAFALLVALLFGAPYLVPRGVSGVYLQGLLLASAHVVLALAFASKPRLPALGLASATPWRWLVLAPVVGLGARFVGVWLSRVVPSTGVAPVEELVRMPSGMLAFAAVAVLAPVAEELFFRGLLYGVLEARFGRGAAVLGATLLFALVHLPQQWGAWGAFASVAFLGLALSLLRRWSGGTTAPALAHLVHNAVVTLMVLG
ncbi:MAG: CPBP family intramembrane metalloprotease [Deltaproteobacteria bacterium]|nr:CPBP family intramembrane metalloprotease [Deltaproteobacteria bacterium]